MLLRHQGSGICTHAPTGVSTGSGIWRHAPTDGSVTLRECHSTEVRHEYAALNSTADSSWTSGRVRSRGVSSRALLGYAG